MSQSACDENTPTKILSRMFISIKGMSMTNTSPLCYPTRSKERTFGTNPITLAAPGKNNDSFVLDMATSTVAFGKVYLPNSLLISIFAQFFD